MKAELMVARLVVGWAFGMEKWWEMKKVGLRVASTAALMVATLDFLVVDLKD